MSPDMIDAIVNRKTRNTEVAALRAEVATLQNDAVEYCHDTTELRTDNDALRAEVERLRGGVEVVCRPHSIQRPQPAPGHKRRGISCPRSAHEGAGQ
jgi:hypothetical protein